MRILVVVLFILAGCANFDKEMSQIKDTVKEGVLYKRDMLITGNGISGEGVITMPPAQAYDLHVISRGDLDTFILRTCSRNWVKESAWNVTEIEKYKKFLKWEQRTIERRREITIKFVPNDVEKDFRCPIELIGAEASSGQHSFGFINFQSEREMLKATVHCDGDNQESIGSYACQSREGNIARVTLLDDAIAVSKCTGLSTEKGRVFDIKLDKGDCTYMFKSLGSGHNTFRLQTYGYEVVPLRK